MSNCSFKLTLGLCLSQSQVLQAIGGTTESIFPQVENKLISSSDLQNALRYVGSRKKMSNYRSMLDFMFCELHPYYRNSCQRFYDHDGPPLRERINAEQVAYYNRYMLTALDVAYKLFCEKRCRSWSWYRKEVKEAFQAAA